ncbi:basic 7S globulin-like isoform X2 [Cucurbita maxima]|uniref:Basic 7S globulin-like isoform X1 n=1 Tax=Cucurbita maxima TaxID=3661 RepID=A0A6J1KM09_CUCMA|nr:basic 7S globulin-like isoform X1 [Cucurbita maxima]XP_023000214.1 basic 7S globulin-like isoform X2 [Cucurbita maxima]
MAVPQSHSLLLLICFFSFFHGRTFSLVIPVTKDSVTNQYLASVYHGSPIKPIHLAVDLGGPSLWMACGSSTSSRTIQSRSIQCVAATGDGSRSGSGGGACEVVARNPFGALVGKALLVEDTVAVRALARSTAAVIVAVHSCAPRFLLQGLAKSAKGILGLGRNQISLPAQIATELGFHRRFSVCLSSTNGVVFPESGSQDSVYGSEISNSLTYTPILTKIIDGSQSAEYFINVKAIKVDGNRLVLDKSLLDLDSEDGGGTRLSTVVPYTALESSIFKSLTAAFREAARAMNMKEVAPVASFEVCFASENMEMTATGPKVPKIELILQSEMVRWKFDGRNSMVKVNDETFCLAIVDGGLKPKNAVVLGGYQMEDIVLDFDMGSSMLGFSSSLLQRKRSCSEFSPENLLKSTE